MRKFITALACATALFGLGGCGEKSVKVHQYDISTVHEIDELEVADWGEVLKEKLSELGIDGLKSFKASQATNYKAECYLKTNNDEVYILLKGDGENGKWEVEEVADRNDSNVVYYNMNQPNYEGEYTKDIYDYKTKEQIHSMNAESKAEQEKRQLKYRLQATIQNYESIDILTSTEGGYSASIQIKQDITREDAIEYSETLKPKIQEIIEKYDLEIINSNYQLVLLIDQDGNTNQ